MTSRGEYDDRTNYEKPESFVASPNYAKNQSESLRKEAIDRLTTLGSKMIDSGINAWEASEEADKDIKQLLEKLEEYIHFPSWKPITNQRNINNSVQSAKTFWEQLKDRVKTIWRKALIFLIFAIIQGVGIFGILFSADLKYISSGTFLLFIFYFIMENDLKKITKL